MLEVFVYELHFKRGVVFFFEVVTGASLVVARSY